MFTISCFNCTVQKSSCPFEPQHYLCLLSQHTYNKIHLPLSVKNIKDRWKELTQGEKKHLNVMTIGEITEMKIISFHFQNNKINFLKLPICPMVDVKIIKGCQSLEIRSNNSLLTSRLITLSLHYLTVLTASKISKVIIIYKTMDNLLG